MKHLHHSTSERQLLHASWYSCERAAKSILFIYTILLMSLLPFWALNVSVAVLSMQGQKAPGFHQKYLNLCFKYGFGTTRGWVINDRISIFLGWTIPLRFLEKRDGGNTHLCSIATMKNKEKTANSNICVLYPTTNMHQDHVNLFNCQLLTLHGLHVKA